MNCRYSKSGEHDFQEISRAGYDLQEVVEWCRHCGTLETFDEIDNRAMNVKNFRPTSVTND